MTIKVEIQEADKPAYTYPCLKIFVEIGAIVLFTGKKKGVSIVEGGSACPTGYYSEEWREEEAEIYNGSITLSNK